MLNKVKKLAILISIIALFLIMVMPVSAKKDKCITIQSGELLTSDGRVITTGYDEWGYNYQAHLFNGYYCDSYRDAEWCQPYKDVKLMMKWNDAWLANKDCDEDGLLDRHFGYSSYIGSGAWLTNHQSGSYLSMVGDWQLKFDYNGAKYNHEMTIGDNSFSGIGKYPAGGPYTITWTVVGTVDGNDVEMTISYDSSLYEVEAIGTIAEDGTMSGDWTSNTGQSGTWISTTGAATTCGWNYFVKIVAVPDDAYADGGVWYMADGAEIGEVIWGAFAITQEVSNDSCAGEHGLQYKSPASAGLGFYKP